MNKKPLCAVLILLALGLGACASATKGAEPIGELLGTWSEEEENGGWVTEIGAPALITNAADLDHWLQSVPDDAPGLDRLTAVDLGSAALVLGSYPRCTETSAVYRDVLEEDRLILRWAVEREEGGDVCEWSPMTLDAWAVPRDETGEREPLALSTSRSPERSGRAQAVGSLAHTWSETDAKAQDLAQVVERRGSLITSNDQRDAFLVDMAAVVDPGAPDPEGLQDMDMSGNLLVVTGYRQCTERSAVLSDTAREPTLLWIEITAEEDVLCAWSPYTIDVWQVPYADVSEQVELGQYRPYESG